MPISVLYIHHSGYFGGASRSLLEMIESFPDKTVQPFLLTQTGQVGAIFRERGIEVIETVGISQFDHTRYGHYRSFRWLILLREIFYFPFTVLAIIKARLKWKNIEIIHINEVTNIPSIILVRLFFKCPIFIHVRSVQQNEDCSYRKKLVTWILGLAKKVIAIDIRVKNSLPIEHEVDIIRNGLNKINNNKTAKHYLKGNFKKEVMTIAFIGSLTKMKGIYELLTAVKLCAERKVNVKLLIVGKKPKKALRAETYILNKLGLPSNTRDFCEDFITKNSLGDFIDFCGFTLEIEDIFNDADVVCFPSHLNAVGRPVIEAALHKLPSIVAIDDEEDDMIFHQKTGLRIKEKSAESLFHAINYFYMHPQEIKRMGVNAHKLAHTKFDIRLNSKKMLVLYEESLGNNK
jgi:glycosyltransferase involved in cell wall biosynthesis